MEFCYIPSIQFFMVRIPSVELIDTQIDQYQLVEQNSSNLLISSGPTLSQQSGADKYCFADGYFPICGAAKVKVCFLDIFPKLQVRLQNRNEEDESGASRDDCAGRTLKGEKRGPGGV